jgi:PIN domain nuclease of toxin-antitoxin system
VCIARQVVTLKNSAGRLAHGGPPLTAGDITREKRQRRLEPVLLWWLGDDPQLSPTARNAISDPAAEALVSAASAWEIAIKRSLGKITAPDDLLEIAADEGFVFLAVTPWHAWRAGALPLHHRDPFDRLLAAQALVEGIPLVTADPSFGPYGVGVRW